MMNLKKKILIIGYGGTIVMVVDSERKAVVPAKNVEEILKLIPNLENVAGSVPINGEFSFLPFINKAVNEYKVPVIVSTKFLGGNSYKEINDDNAIKAIEAGAIPGGDLTDIMTEVKLMWLLAQGTASADTIREKVLTDYVGEITPIKRK